jgi:DNA polymerase III delta' subunit
MNSPKVKGQARAAQKLYGMLSADRLPSAIILHGMEGTGKTIMALEFAKTILCRERRAPDAPYCGFCSDCLAVDKRNHPDLALVNADYQASLREEEAAKQKSLRVETIRHLRRDMEMRSLMGNWKIAIVEDAHTMEIESANALLKILEEPNPRTLWLLVTAQRERLPRTVLSRCFSVAFAPLPEPVVRAILEDQGVDSERARAAAELCEGSASRARELAGGDYPRSLTAGPLAPLAAADSLPREGYLARTQAESALFALAQDLRVRHLHGGLSFAQVERPLREIARLRQALRSNADPKAVMTLACLAAEDVGPGPDVVAGAGSPPLAGNGVGPQKI